mgnify:CR=1 FL=1
MLLVLAGLVVTVVIGLVRGATAPVETVTVDDLATTGTPEADLYVHVSGAVAGPGLYVLADGARVMDAVAAAGGFTGDADSAAADHAEPDAARMGVARACFKRGDHHDGREMLQELIESEIHKHRIWPYVELINMAFNYLEDYKYTVELCRSLFQNVGAGIQNHKHLEHIPVCHLGLCLSKLGKFDESKKVLTRYMLENPDNSEYRLALSQGMRTFGRKS